MIYKYAKLRFATVDSDVFGYHESMALHAFDDKIKINLIFSSKNLYIPNISYFASKNDYFYPNICIFENFVVNLHPKCENILIIEIFAFGLHE